jgi:putative oxidoreductase
MNTNRDLAALVARILLSIIFIMAGFHKITGFEGTVGYIASKGLPMPQLMAIGAIAAELGGGLLLLVGYKARWAALAIFLFLIPTTLIFHNFWAVPPDQYQAQMGNFMKNLTIMGGMLMVWALGPGRFAFDRDTVAA